MTKFSPEDFDGREFAVDGTGVPGVYLSQDAQIPTGMPQWTESFTERAVATMRAGTGPVAIALAERRRRGAVTDETSVAALIAALEARPDATQTA